MLTRWFIELATHVKCRRSFKKNQIMYVKSSNVWHTTPRNYIHISECTHIPRRPCNICGISLMDWHSVVTRWIWDEKSEPCSQWRRNLREEVFHMMVVMHNHFQMMVVMHNRLLWQNSTTVQGNSRSCCAAKREATHFLSFRLNFFLPRLSTEEPDMCVWNSSGKVEGSNVTLDCFQPTWYCACIV